VILGELKMTIDISKFWLGMNNDWLLANTDTSYPRYNIVENADNGNYRIEVAIPGWSKKELELVQEETNCSSRGKKKENLVQLNDSYTKDSVLNLSRESLF
jgi:HSP20 family molecular chaperone IbpA